MRDGLLRKTAKETRRVCQWLRFSQSLNSFIIGFVEATSHMNHGAIQQLDRTHEDRSQISDGVGRRLFGIRFRRVGGFRRTGRANHASGQVLHAA
jgi:hypothetical protein